MTEHHKVLGVEPNASKDEIKKAYRKLAMQHHPDKGGNSAKFKKISAAYEALTSDKQNGMHGMHGMHGSPFDIFAEMFHGGGQGFHRTSSTPSVREVSKNIHISLAHACLGIRKELRIQDKVKCSCALTCSKCNGRGTIQVTIRQELGFSTVMRVEQRRCESCNGRGFCSKVLGCKDCNETCETNKEHIIELEIPPGTIDGTIFDKRNVLENVILRFVINISNEANMNHAGNNIEFHYNIGFIDAICGTDIKITHPRGETLMFHTSILPEIIHDGMIHSIQGKGINSKGVLKVIFKIRRPYPTPLSLADGETLKTKLSALINKNTTS